MDRISAHEAGAELGALLDRVQQGEEIVIMRGGEPVARLIPSLEAGSDRHQNPQELLERFRALRERIAARGESFTWEELKQMRDEGRP